MLFPAGYFPPGYFPPAYFGGISAMPQVVLDVIVGYAPDPLHAALTLTEGGNVFGPFPASGAANGDGTYTLTAALSTLPAGLVPGTVSIQPGNWVGGVFTAIGPAIVGDLLDNDAASEIDVLSVTGPYTDIASQSTSLMAGSTDFIHVGVSAQTTTETAYDVTKAQVDILIGDLLTGSWQPAAWNTDTSGIVYASLLVTANNLSGTAGNWPSSLWYMVWIRFTISNVTKIKRVGRLLLLTG